jgi:hypothetical protein
MITTKSAKKTMKSIKKAAVEQMSHITTNEKIAGAAAIGVAVGVAATALGSSLLHGAGGDADAKSAPADAKKATPKG